MTTIGEHHVQTHYDVAGLIDAIRRGLERAGKRLDAITAEDLAAVDAFHAGGREASTRLARLAEVNSTLRVLDIGSGIGGTARYLASTYGCDVTGVDLNPGFCAVATELSAMVGLATRTRFQRASALELPFPGGSFDLAWSEHVQMNISDKLGFYREAARILGANGRLAFHDVFRGPAGEPDYPLPWADDRSISALCSADVARGLLATLGLEVVHWVDDSDRVATSLSLLAARLYTADSQSLGLHLVMTRDARAKVVNFLRGLADRRLQVVQAVVRRRAGAVNSAGIE